MSTQPTNSSQNTPAVSSSMMPPPPGNDSYRRNKNSTDRSKDKGLADRNNEVSTGNLSQTNAGLRRTERSSFYNARGYPDPFNIGSEEAARNLNQEEVPNLFSILQKLSDTVAANQEFNQTQFKILESRITESGPPITPRN